eukprot:1519447-Prymnesium_polylepis.1
MHCVRHLVSVAHRRFVVVIEHRATVLHWLLPASRRRAGRRLRRAWLEATWETPEWRAQPTGRRRLPTDRRATLRAAVLGTSFGTLEQRDGVIEGAEFDRRWAIALDVTWATTVVANHFDALPVVGVITHLKSKSPFLRGTRLDGLGEVHGVRGAKIGGSSSVTSHIHASLLQAVQRVTGAHGITVGVIVLDAVRSLIDMWVPDLGLALRVRP